MSAATPPNSTGCPRLRAGGKSAYGYRTGSADPGETVPGGVYLCQVDERLSCGACCGLYNLPEAGEEEALEKLLQRRTEEFLRIPRQVDAIAAFGERSSHRAGDRGPIPDFHHCPYVGLIGDGQRKVGCLLHPLAAGNRGTDFRGLSYYGGMACRIYFCPSHDALAPAWKEIVKRTAGSWYLYGLIVTEDKLLAGFFGAVEEKLGRPLTEEDAGGAGCAAAYRDFFRLKLDWPFRPPGVPGPANYFFKDRSRSRPPVAYPPGHTAPRKLDAIYRALGAAFETESALADAEQRVLRPIDAVVKRLTGR